MRFRTLRIAFSATCLIACVLLIVLWVRSYWWVDQIDFAISKSNFFGFASVSGHVCAYKGRDVDKYSWHFWQIRSTPAIDPRIIPPQAAATYQGKFGFGI